MNTDMYSPVELNLLKENFNEMRLDQPTRDRLRYTEQAMEAVTNPIGKGKLVQKLWQDIFSKNNVDFGKIPDSRGDITRYAYYDPMAKTIDTLNELFAGTTNEILTLMNKLNGMIITCRADFEFGYRYDVDIIKLTYQLLVVCLYEIINICMSAYTDYLRDVKNIEVKFGPYKSNELLMVKFTKDFIKSYESGEWRKMIKTFREDPQILNKMVSMGASEGTLLDTFNDVKEVGKEIKGAAPEVRQAVKSAWDAIPKGAKIATAVLGSTVVMLFMIRKLVHAVYGAAGNISNSIKYQTEFLKASIERNANTRDDVATKQKKFLDRLERIKSAIDTKIIKGNNDAKVSVSKANKEEFKKDTLTTDNDIELL